MEEGSWSQSAQEAVDFKHELASMTKAGSRLLPLRIVRRLQACFASLVSRLLCTCEFPKMVAMLDVSPDA